MNIKLHARLSAYSKISSVKDILPTPTAQDDKSILGVRDGKYVLFKDTTPEQIDTLFEDTPNTNNVSDYNPIDDLFK